VAVATLPTWRFVEHVADWAASEQNNVRKVRGVIQGMLLQNSADSRLIQAADFVSYAGYQHIRDVRGASYSATRNEVDLYRRKLANSYRQILRPRWLSSDDQGVNWIEY
jgi:hypothetical protein